MRFSVLCILFILTGCNLNQLQEVSIEESSPVFEIRTDWQTATTGLDYRTYTTEAGFIFEVVRIDPNYFHFRTHYQPDNPQRIVGWQSALPSASVIVNANFFAVDNTIQGLLISDSIQHGQSYSDRGGTFFVQNGIVGIRSNIFQPYQGEAYEQALQAFPMLVYNGQSAYNNIQANRPSRRTIIGQDAQGRIILMVTPAFGPGLYDLSQYLTQTDIGFVNAFNLDGGGSSMLYRASDDYFVYSFDPVPAVLAVYPKQ